MNPISILHESFEFALENDLYLRGDVKVAQNNGKNPKPVFIFVHGFKGFKDWGANPYIVEQFAQKGFYCIIFNFSCNGVNKVDFDELDKFSVNTYSREQEDLSVLLKLLKEQQLPLAEYADPTRISLLGHSRGGGESIIFAAEQPEIKALVTWNSIAGVNLFADALKEEILRNGIAYVPNARTKQMMPIRVEFLQDIEQNAERFDIPKRLAGLSIPVLVIQGDEDSQKLVNGFGRLKEAAPQQTFATIHGGNHTFGAVHPFAGTTPQLEEAIRISQDFLSKQMELQ